MIGVGRGAGQGSGAGARKQLTLAVTTNKQRGTCSLWEVTDKSTGTSHTILLSNAHVLLSGTKNLDVGIGTKTASAASQLYRDEDLDAAFVKLEADQLRSLLGLMTLRDVKTWPHQPLMYGHPMYYEALAQRTDTQLVTEVIDVTPRKRAKERECNFYADIRGGHSGSLVVNKGGVLGLVHSSQSFRKAREALDAFKKAAASDRTSGEGVSRLTELLEILVTEVQTPICRATRWVFVEDFVKRSLFGQGAKASFQLKECVAFVGTCRPPTQAERDSIVAILNRHCILGRYHDAAIQAYSMASSHHNTGRQESMKFYVEYVWRDKERTVPANEKNLWRLRQLAAPGEGEEDAAAGKVEEDAAVEKVEEDTVMLVSSALETAKREIATQARKKRRSLSSTEQAAIVEALRRHGVDEAFGEVATHAYAIATNGAYQGKERTMLSAILQNLASGPEWDDTLRTNVVEALKSVLD